MSEDKARRSVTLDPENDDLLSQSSINASGLVNRLVTNYRTAGEDDVAMFRLRESQLKSEVEGLENRLEMKREELKRVRQQIGAFEDSTEDVLREAAENLDPTTLNADNPAVRNWAGKAGLTPEDFVERVQDYA